MLGRGISTARSLDSSPGGSAPRSADPGIAGPNPWGVHQPALDRVGAFDELALVSSRGDVDVPGVCGDVASWWSAVRGAARFFVFTGTKVPVSTVQCTSSAARCATTRLASRGVACASTCWRAVRALNAHILAEKFEGPATVRKVFLELDMRWCPAAPDQEYERAGLQESAPLLARFGSMVVDGCLAQRLR